MTTAAQHPTNRHSPQNHLHRQDSKAPPRVAPPVA